MLQQECNNIKVNPFYMNRNASDFLGFLPVLDHEENSYYTVENIHPEKNYERVSPVFGEYNTDVRTEKEWWYEQEQLPKGSREVHVLDHEFYRGEVLERIARCPYCVWFVGCDDGDKFMRFESKEAALEFFKYIDFYDEIDAHPLCQHW